MSQFYQGHRPIHGHPAKDQALILFSLTTKRSSINEVLFVLDNGCKCKGSEICCFFRKNSYPTFSRNFPTYTGYRTNRRRVVRFVDSAKVMAKGQVTIPKDIRKVLGVENGDRVTFVVEGSAVRLVNSAAYAMQIFQEEMKGEAERAGLRSDDDVIALVKELRDE